MNERIKELREQAANYASATYSNYTMATFDTNKSIETLFEEKFAELIIRKCAAIAGKAEYSDTWLEPVEDAIKEHFGVEQ
jgi:hypothetical protein